MNVLFACAGTRRSSLCRKGMKEDSPAPTFMQRLSIQHLDTAAPSMDSLCAPLTVRSTMPISRACPCPCCPCPAHREPAKKKRLASQKGFGAVLPTCWVSTHLHSDIVTLCRSPDSVKTREHMLRYQQGLSRAMLVLSHIRIMTHMATMSTESTFQGPLVHFSSSSSSMSSMSKRRIGPVLSICLKRQGTACLKAPTIQRSTLAPQSLLDT